MTIKYVTNTGNFKEFLTRVKNKEIGLSDKVNKEFLKTVGYKSGNDYSIVTVLKTLDFLDSNNQPTEAFQSFRTEKSGQVMASALRTTYSELFSRLPEPQKKSDDELENFFATVNTKARKSTLKCYIDTFRALAEFADFGAEIEKTDDKDKGKDESSKNGETYKGKTLMPEGFELNMNIQITLPVTEDAKVYENIFKALREQLFKKE